MSHASLPSTCCRYNCAGLRFGKVDIGRYGEVSERWAAVALMSRIPRSTGVDRPINYFWTGTRLVPPLWPSSCPHCCSFKEGGSWWDVQWWTIKGELCLGPSMRCAFSVCNKHMVYVLEWVLARLHPLIMIIMLIWSCLIPRRTSSESLTSTSSSRNPRNWTKAAAWRERSRTAFSQRRVPMSFLRTLTPHSSPQRARKTSEERRMIWAGGCEVSPFLPTLPCLTLLLKSRVLRNWEKTTLDVTKKKAWATFLWSDWVWCSVGLNAATQKIKWWFGDVLLQTLNYLITNAFFL